jgi:hypothetical protein
MPEKLVQIDRVLEKVKKWPLWADILEKALQIFFSNTLFLMLGGSPKTPNREETYLVTCNLVLLT